MCWKGSISYDVCNSNREVKKVEKVKQSKRLVIASSTLLLLALVIEGVYWQTMPSVPQPSPSQSASPPILLTAQEIREYEGQDLSSISDFRENSIRGPQYINISTYSLTITGLVNKTLEYTYDDVINGFQKYLKVVTLFCVEGWSVKILWEGFLLQDLLNQAGINPQATAVIFYAYDGYSTSMPLSYLLDNNILIAYKMNNVTLPPERGFPFQLVSESKYGYKWIKWITKIELSDNETYLGYWESRGWPNDANLPFQTTKVSSPTFGPSGGTYPSAQNVTLRCSTSDAIIRYTIDGSEPSSSSALYSGPILVNTTTTIKAKAFVIGMTDSDTASATYTIKIETNSVDSWLGNWPSYVAVGAVALVAIGLLVYFKKRKRGNPT